MIRSLNSLIAVLLLLAVGGGISTLMMASSNSRPRTAGGAPPTTAAPTTTPVGRPTRETATQSEAGPEAPAQYVGVIFARQSADIVARSEGRLEAIQVNLGDHLKPGHVIARIESHAITQQLEMAEAALRSAQAEERSAEADRQDAEARYARREKLVEEGLLSKEELATAGVQVAKAGANLEIMRARVAEHAARVEQVKVSLAHTTVKAAFEGIVAARYLDPGATVTPGTPIISLLRPNDLWVRFAVPETKQANIHLGSTINFGLAGLGVTIPAVIEHFAPGVAPVSPEVVVEARLKIPAPLSGRIKPGGSGLVSLSSRVR